MQLTTVARSLLALKHPIAPDHAGYPEPVIPENVRPPPRLRRLMLTELSPPFDPLLITPEGERKNVPR